MNGSGVLKKAAVTRPPPTTMKARNVPAATQPTTEPTTRTRTRRKAPAFFGTHGATELNTPIMAEVRVQASDTFSPQAS